MKKALIIDDDTFVCKQLQTYLHKNGVEAIVAYSANNGLKALKTGDIFIVVCDYRLPDADGMEVFAQIRKLDPWVPVVFMTAYADVRTAVQAIKAGALDYVTKPLIPEEILRLIRRIMDREPGANRLFQHDFVSGESASMQSVMNHVELVAPCDLSVLVEGETGSGKEYIARAIHSKSKRKDKPFVALDCGAMPGELANSELFGHVKGAFTGAVQDKKGCFEEADGGTLFLDEVGNLSMNNQVKLLRTLQEKTINRLGDNKNIPVDVRIITATNEDLMGNLPSHHFREDLYHRINGFKILIPPLRKRKEDIFLFAAYFIKIANADFGKSVEGIEDEVQEIFLRYPWPGNIRELENIVKRCVLLSGGSDITTDTLPDEIRYFGIEEQNDASFPGGTKRPMTLKQAAMLAEKEAILHALEEVKNNKSRAAEILQVDRKTLYNKMREYSIRFPQ
ncbi:MAG: sigma-54-dependent transcriptional regulator [Bacteroidales bacterium]